MDQIISTRAVLKGSISEGSSKLTGSISKSSGLSGSITTSDRQLHDIYRGEVMVKPSTKTSQVLQTKNKILTDDIHIEKIEYIETSNMSNGKTVYIGVD